MNILVAILTLIFSVRLAGNVFLGFMFADMKRHNVRITGEEEEFYTKEFGTAFYTELVLRSIPDAMILVDILYHIL